MLNSLSVAKRCSFVIVFVVIVSGCVVDRAYGQVSAGDVNLDGHVDASDVTKMAYVLTDPVDLFVEFAEFQGLTLRQANFVLDVNQDGVFNNEDLQALINVLLDGNGSASTVPEPSSLILLSLGGLSCLAFSKRFLHR